MKSVLIVGATSSLASDFTRQCLTRGYRVRAVTRSQDKARDVFGDDLAQLECVVAPDMRTLPFEQVASGMDAMVYFPGLIAFQSFLDQPDEAHDELFEVNAFLAGAFMRGFVTAALKAKRPGMVIGIGAANLDQPMPMTASYFASKQVLRSYLRSIAVEFGDKGMKTLLVSPSTIATAKNLQHLNPAHVPMVDPKKVHAAIFEGLEGKDRETAREVLVLP